jgi:hypothetical protein
MLQANVGQAEIDVEFLLRVLGMLITRLRFRGILANALQLIAYLTLTVIADS